VTLGEDPFTSGGVCRNFLEQHMQH
jgi:hypothetical protein